MRRDLVERAMAHDHEVFSELARLTIDDRERVGWWLIDPATGRVTDQLDDGRASVTTERVIMGIFIAIVGFVLAKYAQQVWKEKVDPMVRQFERDMGQVTN